jgi:hypothetical protein
MYGKDDKLVEKCMSAEDIQIGEALEWAQDSMLLKR